MAIVQAARTSEKIDEIIALLIRKGSALRLVKYDREGLCVTLNL